MPYLAVVLCLCWLVPIVVYKLSNAYITKQRRTLRTSNPDLEEAPRDAAGDEVDEANKDLGLTVLYSSLEHVIPGCPKAKVVAGGLGKVTELLAKHHPGDLIMVHPMLGTGPDVSYDGVEFAEEPPLRLMVAGVQEKIRVLRHSYYPRGDNGPRVDMLLLSHRFFEERTKAMIYPNPMTRTRVLCFWSLWNQAVGELIVRHRADIFHCPDYHSAVAPWYARPRWPEFRMLLVLHNAEYQGIVTTETICGKKLTEMAKIWNLPAKSVRRHLLHEGYFNMLKAGVDYSLRVQRGRGVSAVSHFYANECHSTYSVLWKLPVVEGLDNPMLEDERPELLEAQDLAAAKRAAKKDIQAQFLLEQNPDARIFVSLGRLVRQKGIDLIADVAPWLLTNYPNAQLIVVGPVGDGFGRYAAEKLASLSDSPEFCNRVFVKAEFMKVPQTLKLAADFCLMPSRDEPFGYVDIEFAWHGAVMVGAQAGGLGKVPGFYYVAQNRDNLGRLRLELSGVLGKAMRAPAEDLEQMSVAATQSEFPLLVWQKRLLAAYSQLSGGLQSGTRSRANSTTSGSGSHSDFSTSIVRSDSRTTTISLADESISDEPLKQVPELQSQEFLKQELDEAQLAARVQEKLAKHPGISMDDIVEKVGDDLSLESETNPISRLLLRPVFGIHLVHWLVSLGYVSSSLSSILTTAVATEWAQRGENRFTVWFLSEEEEFDITYIKMWLTSADAVGFLLGAPVWALLSRFMQPRHLLVLNMLMRVAFTPAIKPMEPDVDRALFASAYQGAVAAGFLLFIVFNFMASIKTDISHVAMRMGVMEMLRHCVAWLVSAYVFAASPTAHEGTVKEPIPHSVTDAFLPLAIAIGVVNFVPAVLLLFAPGPYRTDRSPGFDLALIFKRKSFWILGLSDCIGKLSLFGSTAYLSWWMADRWTDKEISIICLAVVATFFATMLLWTFALSRLSRQGLAFLIGVVVFLAPPSIIRAITFQEVSTYQHLGRSFWPMVICVGSLVLEAMRSSAIWSVQIRVVGSRWRLLSYGMLLLMVGQVCAGFSPWICEDLAERVGATFVSSNPRELGMAMAWSVVPIALAQFAAQVLAACYIRRDLGLSVPTRRAQNSAMRRVLTRANLGCVAFFWFVMAGMAVWLSFPEIHRDNSVHHCPIAYVPQCAVLSDVHDAGLYGLNHFKQSTTGKYQCHKHMREMGGDTFVHWDDGRCQVQACGSHPTGSETALAPGAEVWSSECSQYGQNLIITQLFEWTWNDVARECEEYLGPAGFDVVQIAPPQEHILGHSWYTRYQPTSFKLESRGGTTEEFVSMVDRCRRAGVSVMVDVVINHMASQFVVSPSEVAGQKCGQEHTPKCEGWNGTIFGNRDFLNAPEGYGHFGQEDFHHIRGKPDINCGIDESYGAVYDNNLLCDLVGLPDLDTELPKVQRELGAYLRRLYDMGVTMFRIDAARHIYPESLAKLLYPIPLDYVVMEFYASWWNLGSEMSLLRRFWSMPYSVTDFRFGYMNAQVLFDAFVGMRWEDRSDAFEQLLNINEHLEVPGGCNYEVCDTKVPEHMSLRFLDNHDQQRERWKSNHHRPGVGSPETPLCNYDITKISHAWVDGWKGHCRPIYKQGIIYHIAQLQMLAWPYGDAVRIMSSYSFDDFGAGPPGVATDSLRGETLSVFNGSATRCRAKPATTPVTDEYDGDIDAPWVCEHRWQGVPGLVRFRKLVGRDHAVRHKWSSGQGHVAYTLGDVGFVALSRGYNSETHSGSHASLDLQGMETGLPAGSYCNLARASGPVPAPAAWAGHCGHDVDGMVVVDSAGFIVQGKLPAGDAIAIHASYRS